MLDEAEQSGTYAAICTFHFGNENFLDSQPYLMRWYGRLPMVALQDAHGSEAWWWSDFLSGFRTLFIAKEPTWEEWLKALERNQVLAVRRDRVTKWSTYLAGGSEVLRSFVKARPEQWCWWGDHAKLRQRPAAALTVLHPDMPFEVAAPKAGVAVRLRLWADNNGRAYPLDNRAELVSLEIDNTPVQPTLVSSKTDRYYLYNIPGSGAREATARVRVLSSGEETKLSVALAP